MAKKRKTVRKAVTKKKINYHPETYGIKFDSLTFLLFSTFVLISAVILVSVMLGYKLF